MIAMNIWKSLAGTYRIEITSASPTESLTAINCAGIDLFNVSYIDELTFRADIDRRKLNSLQKLLGKIGASVKIIRKNGLFWSLSALGKRPVLTVGLTIFLFLIFYMPTCVFFVNVEGNTTIPTKLILEKAQECGIAFGASRREVRSEKIKNALLESIPQLQWAGINTSGCTAIISVRERSEPQSVPEQKGVSSIVAKKDGIITEITVLKGNPLCRVGQAVRAGQVLVSGYTDCGIFVRAECANAEIFAQTHHVFTAVTPVDLRKRDKPIKSEISFQLLIGKKLIKFTKDSGISDAGCVKMYKENYLMLPGGFQLPIALITEERHYYSMSPSLDKDDFTWMQILSEKYVETQMLAGKIIQKKYAISSNTDLYCATNEFDCVEMIGHVRSEEIIDGNGERN